MTPEDKEAAMSEAVEAVAQAIHDPASREAPSTTAIAKVALRALLEPRVTSCETCGGHQVVPEDTAKLPDQPVEDWNPSGFMRCADCNGSGQVTRPSIAILRGEGTE